MSALPRKALLDAMPHLAGLSFPLDEAKLLEIVNAIKEAPSLPNAPRQEPPRLHPSMPPVERHRRIQQYIEAFEYNFTGENFFNVKGVRQNQSLFRVLELAKRVMREALPIKCVEAVYLGIYLTQSMQDMERLPLIFNSEIGGHRYGHIVLLVRYNGKLGALGLSRRPDLMYKAWGFETLSDIIAEYKRSYEHWSHSLLKIKIGTIIPHEGSGKLLDVVDWAHTVISLKGQTWEETDLVLHRKARSLGWESRGVSVAPGMRKSHSTSATSSPSKKPAANNVEASLPAGDEAPEALREKPDGEREDAGEDEDNLSGTAGAGGAAHSRHSFLGV